MINILIIEDDHQFAEKCTNLLLKNNWQVVYCENAEEAKTLFLETHFDIVLTDLMLPPRYDDEGLKFLQFLRINHPSIEPFLMTSRKEGTVEIVAEAMRLGAKYFFDKNASLFDEKLILNIKELIMMRKRNIFISHGHNELLKLKLKDFISSRLHKTPIILAEQPNRGLTVVEKLERVSEECSFAVILMTTDDEQKSGGLRARQNVIHEIGFFQGKYGRKNVILLAERGVEMFTNISGIIRIEFDNDNFESAYEPLRMEIEGAFADQQDS